MEKINLTEKTLEALNYIRENGGRVSTAELMVGLGCEKIASVTGRVNSLVNKEMATREYETITDENGKDKKICYVNLTEKGQNFTPDAE